MINMNNFKKISKIWFISILFILMLGSSVYAQNPQQYKHLKAQNIELIGNRFKHDIAQEDKNRFLKAADEVYDFKPTIEIITTKEYSMQTIKDSFDDALSYFPRGQNTVGVLKYTTIGNKITIVPEYRTNIAQTKAVGEYVDKIINQVPNDWKIYDKIAYINLSIASLPYSHNLPNKSVNLNGYSTQTGYSLINGGGYCAAFADMFNIAMDKMGIPAITVIGKATNPEGSAELHQWSLINIDGKWYHVDTTWTKSRMTTNITKKGAPLADRDAFILWDTFMVDDSSDKIKNRSYPRDTTPKANERLKLNSNNSLESRYRVIFINTLNVENIPKTQDGLPMIMLSQYRNSKKEIFSFGFVDNLILAGVNFNGYSYKNGVYNSFLTQDWFITNYKHDYNRSGKLMSYKEGKEAYNKIIKKNPKIFDPLVEGIANRFPSNKK